MRRVLFALAVFSWATMVAGSVAAQTQPPNILMIIADDVGAEVIEAYNGRHLAPYTAAEFAHSHTPGPDGHPHTDTISGLAADGIVFLNAWSNPACGTTRATIQTGRYGHRTQILSADGTLGTEELTIPEVLKLEESGYKSAMVGKWGLCNGVSCTDLSQHPVFSGYDYFAGVRGTGLPSYTSWHREVCSPSLLPCVDSSGTSTTYPTIAHRQDAEAWLASLPPNDPWFLVLAFTAARAPFHVPPKDLYDDPSLPNSNPFQAASCPAGMNGRCYRAAIEAMDDQIGLMLHSQALAPDLANTIVIFVGDNGSPQEPDPLNPAHSKFTVFQGGVNVPLIVKGPGIQGGRVSGALVNTSDLFTTVLDLAGVEANESLVHDSYSLVPILHGSTDAIRHFAYTEIHGQGPGHPGKAIRNRAGLKLQRSIESGSSPLWYAFDLKTNPDENELANLVDHDEVPPRALNPALQTDINRLYDLLGNADIPDEGAPPRPNLPPANSDKDADGYADEPTPPYFTDNCPTIGNPDQADADHDGIGDDCDNCRELFQDAGQDCDTDEDGYGNLCDGDFDNDFYVFPSDASKFFADLAIGLDVDGKGTDLDCDGYVFPSDYERFMPMFLTGDPPGPSGLDCAGTQPCAP